LHFAQDSIILFKALDIYSRWLKHAREPKSCSSYRNFAHSNDLMLKYLQISLKRHKSCSSLTSLQILLFSWSFHQKMLYYYQLKWTVSVCDGAIWMGAVSSNLYTWDWKID